MHILTLKSLIGKILMLTIRDKRAVKRLLLMTKDNMTPFYNK